LGQENILRALVNEMQLLEYDGLEINLNGNVVHVRVIVGVVSGDNLFLNGFLGYV
jgi:hypothetical protein